MYFVFPSFILRTILCAPWIYQQYTRYVRKVMRLIRENSFNWRYVYTHLIFFKITSLSINTPLPAVLPRVVARLEVLNWDLLQNIRHCSLQHVFNTPKMVSFQAGFEPGKQKEIGRCQVWAVGRLGQRCPRPISFCFPGSNPAWKDAIFGRAAGCSGECSARDPISRLPGELRRVAEPLATVYWCSRMLFWRILSVC